MRALTRTCASVLQDLRAQPLRAIVTVVAMLVGVLAVVAVTVAGAVTEGLVIAKSEQEVARETTYSVDLTARGGNSDADAFWDALSARIPTDHVGLAMLESRTIWPEPAEGLDAGTPVTVWVVQGDYRAIRRLPLLDGAWPNAGTSRPPVAAANLAAARLLDDSFTFRERTQGVLAVTGTVADGEPAPNLYIDWDVAHLMFPSPVQRESIRVLVRVDHADPTPVRRAAEAAATSTGWTVQAVERHDQIAGIRDELQLVRTAFLICGGIALLVAALGIVNIGLSTIGQRSRELSIRRAVGARRLDLLLLVLGNALAQAVLAAGAAVAIAWVAVAVVVPRAVPPESALDAPTLPWTTVVVALLAAGSTAVIGSLLPAIRAARIDIAAVLRD